MNAQKVMITMIVWNCAMEIRRMIKRDIVKGTSILGSILAAFARAGSIVYVLYWGGFWKGLI